jgi:AraC family transcriptional regulator of arabinose operon
MHQRFSTLRLEVVTVDRRTLDTSWRHDGYCDDVGRIYLIDRGEAFVRHHGRTFVLRPGMLSLIPAATVFDFWCRARFVQRWVHYRATGPGGIDLMGHLGCAFERADDDPARTRGAFERLESASHEQTAAGALEANGILLQLLAPFLASADEAAHRARRDALDRFGEVLAYVETHLDGPLRVEDLAKLAHLERTYFARAFRAALGVAPCRFIQMQRVELAKRLLLETRDKLQVVAAAAGFSDVYHFSRSFKHLSGQTPSAFRGTGGRQP